MDPIFQPGTLHLYIASDEEVLKTVAARRVKDLEALGTDTVVSACAAERAGLSC